MAIAVAHRRGPRPGGQRDPSQWQGAAPSLALPADLRRCGRPLPSASRRWCGAHGRAGRPAAPRPPLRRACEPGDGDLCSTGSAAPCTCAASPPWTRATRMLFLNVHPEAAVADAENAREFADLVALLRPHARARLHRDPRGRVRRRGRCCARRSPPTASSASRIAMDDFGVGRSNFDRIVSLRPDW